MPFLFKKETSKRLTLDPSELLVLKELASFFLSVDFHGSQLEALLHARASQASLLESDTDERIASILTPSPASKSEARAETIIPSQADGATSPTSRSPSVTPKPEGGRIASSTSTRRVVDDSFKGCVIDGTGSTKPVEVDNYSHLNEEMNHAHVESRAFYRSTIKNANVNNHSWNGNVGSFNSSSTAVPHVLNYWH